MRVTDLLSQRCRVQAQRGAHPFILQWLDCSQLLANGLRAWLIDSPCESPISSLKGAECRRQFAARTPARGRKERRGSMGSAGLSQGSGAGGLRQMSKCCHAGFASCRFIAVCCESDTGCVASDDDTT